MSQWDIVFESMKKADFMIEVVDARCPRITRSRKLEDFVSKKEKKPLLIVINKSDLVPTRYLEKIREEFQNDFPTAFVSTRKREGMEFLKTIINKVSPSKDSIAIVVGYPNVGKSSVINFLAKRHSASTSSVPGHTKSAQIIRVSEKLKIFDVPGVLPPEEKFKSFTGTLRPEKSKQIIKDAIELIETITKGKGNNLEEVYGMKFDLKSEFFEILAKKRNMKLAKDEYDIMKAARTVIYDWNSGKLTAWGFD